MEPLTLFPEDDFANTNPKLLWIRLGITTVIAGVLGMYCYWTRPVVNERTVRTLYDACVFDSELHLSFEARQCFGFDACDDEKKLLNLYQDLIFNHLYRLEKNKDKVLQRLLKSVQDKCLFPLLTEIYTREDPYQPLYEWIVQHPEWFHY